MKTVMLTRGQVLKLATFLSLDQGIESVEIEQDHSSGIGPAHRVWFNKSQVEKSYSEDITDVSNW